MKSVFVDSNVFVCFLTDMDPLQQTRAERLFVKARQGQLELVAGPPVLFELAWTLRKFFRYPKAKVHEILNALLGLPGLRLLDRPFVAKALELAQATGVEFADAYIAATAEACGAAAIASFNREDFAKLSFPLHEL